MRRVSMGYLINKSVKRTTLILFKPFSFKKWLLLLFIAAMAGALGGNGSSGGGGNGGDSQEAEAVQEQSVIDVYSEEEGAPAEAFTYDSLTQTAQGNQAMPSKAALFILVPFLVALGLFLVLFFIWIGSRFKFIWFNSIVANDASIKEPFGRFKSEGNSLFRFFLLMFIAVFAFFGMLVLWGYFAGSSAGLFETGADWSFAKGFQAFALPLLVFIGGIVLLVVINVCVEHFVVTIMGIDRSCFLTAWRKFASIAKENLGDLFVYLLMLIGLGIGCGIIGLFIVLFSLIALVIVGGLVFGLSYALLVALLKAKIIYYVFCVIVGIPFAIAALLLLISIQLPFAVFFRCFSLYYLSALNCGYTPLALEEATPPAAA